MGTLTGNGLTAGQKSLEIERALGAFFLFLFAKVR